MSFFFCPIYGHKKALIKWGKKLNHLFLSELIWKLHLWFSHRGKAIAKKTQLKALNILSMCFFYFLIFNKNNVQMRTILKLSCFKVEKKHHHKMASHFAFINNKLRVFMAFLHTFLLFGGRDQTKQEKKREMKIARSHRLPFKGFIKCVQKWN